MITNDQFSRYDRAKKRVVQIRKFYSHVLLYIVANIALIIVKVKFLNLMVDVNDGSGPDFMRWLDWNIISTPIIWGLFLVGHGLWVFYFPKVQDWEERQIQKYMEEEDQDSYKR